MASVEWTNEQKRAIEERDCSLLVAAAAGSGKTAVLVERIIQRILDERRDVDIDKLVIVTFTEAAASEMRERIEKAILDRMGNLTSKDSAEMKSRLKRQLTFLNKATISTMHSFCSKLIRKYFNKLDIEPNFKILDDIEADIIRTETLNKLMDERYEAVNDDDDNIPFENLVDIFGGTRNDEGLKSLVMQIYSFISSSPFPDEWLREQLNKFSEENLQKCESDFRYTIWGYSIFKKLECEIAEVLLKCRQSIELCDDEFSLYLKGINGIYEFYMNLKSIILDGTWDTVYTLFSGFTPERLPNKPKNCDEETNKLIKDMYDELKNITDDYKKIYFLYSSTENLKDIKDSGGLLRDLCDMVLEFSKEYNRAKAVKKSLDYNDLEHLALKLLRENPEISRELQNCYIEVYTDEYQDTNMTQETILNFIIKKSPEIPNLFMVGDIKQSIYGFRQARPDIFLGKYNYFSTDGMKSREKLIKLYKNFRSREDIIGSVNYIFSSIMTKEICNMDYNREEYLYYGADYGAPGFDVSCELLLTDRKEESFSEYQDKKKLETEAAMIAGRITELVSNDGVEYKDIVVLLRAARNRADVFKEVLAEFKIPAFCEVSTGFYQSREIKQILALLQVIDNPIQDIPLLAALKSQIGGFCEDEIICLRLINKDNSLYDNLKEMALSDRKAEAFINKLSELREVAVELSLSELILKIYQETDYYNFAAVFEDGDVRQANLRKLYEEAVSFEEQTRGGIFDFLRLVERIKESGTDSGEAVLLGQSDNVVRIMSIHKSKGLEFPIVFIANMDKGFNRRDYSESIVMHQELGFGVDGFDVQNRLKHETVTKTVMKIKLNNEMLAEEMRLLYVAMTRAKEKLIISGSISGLGDKMKIYWNALNRNSKKLPVNYVLKAKNYFDLAMPILLRHPDMEHLREVAEITPQAGDIMLPQEDEQCRFKVKIYNGEDIFQNRDAGNVETLPETEKYTEDDCLYNLITEKLNYKYKHPELTKLPVKLSVSELKGRQEEEERAELLQKPAFLESGDTKDAAKVGTIIHGIMQHIDINNISEDEIEILCVNRGISSDMMKSINKNRILKFFNSEIGRRLRSSERVCREVPFTMSVNANEIYTGIEGIEEEIILIQGIIDCYFVENGEIVLIDYKTDWIEKGNVAKFAEKYRVQLDMYARALERETGMRVKEKIVYFLNFNEHFQF